MSGNAGKSNVIETSLAAPAADVTIGSPVLETKSIVSLFTTD
jgi:hypothetical protein